MKKVALYKVQIQRVSLFGNDPEPRDTEFMTLDALKRYFGYTYECGESWQYEKGRYKIKPLSEVKGIKSFITNLNKAKSNSCTHYQSAYYECVDTKKVPENMVDSDGREIVEK